METQSSSLHESLRRFASNAGIEISPQHAIDLSLRCSSIEGALEYYLSNIGLFEQADTASEINMQDAGDSPVCHESCVLTASNPILNTSVSDETSLRSTLSSFGFSDGQVEHAIQRCSSVEAAIKLLTETNLPSEEITSYCCICMDLHPISDMVTLSCTPFAHRQGKECFRSYCTNQINEGIVNISCPEANCSTCITIFELKDCLEENIFAKFELFSTRAYCENEQLRRCPNCNDWYIDVSEIVSVERIWKCIKCQKCEFEFCGKCGQRPHKAQLDQDVDCSAFSVWLKQNNESDASFDNYLKQEGILPCPRCGMPGELIDGGCKFMYCRCKANYCALCGSELDETKHYSHFKDAVGCTGPFGTVCKGAIDAVK